MLLDRLRNLPNSSHATPPSSAPYSLIYSFLHEVGLHVGHDIIYDALVHAQGSLAHTGTTGLLAPSTRHGGCLADGQGLACRSSTRAPTCSAWGGSWDEEGGRRTWPKGAPRDYLATYGPHHGHQSSRHTSFLVLRDRSSEVVRSGVLINVAPPSHESMAGAATGQWTMHEALA